MEEITKEAAPKAKAPKKKVPGGMPKTKVQKAEPVEPKVAAAPKKVKTFNKEDLIPCSCAFAGQATLLGKKSGNVYTWDAMGDVQEVEYQDLRSMMLNSNSSWIYKPLIIILDEDVYKDRKEIVDLYKKVFGEKDIKALLRSRDYKKIRNSLKTMPEGIRDSVKNLVASMIQKGQLTDYQAVKTVDDVLGVELTKQFEIYSD